MKLWQLAELAVPDGSYASCTGPVLMFFYASFDAFNVPGKSYDAAAG
ncbi:MAG: hypothetical protein ACLR8P_18620 [Clostridium fessum]